MASGSFRIGSSPPDTPSLRPGIRRCTTDLAEMQRRAGRIEVARLIAHFPTHYDAALALDVSVRTIARWIDPVRGTDAPYWAVRLLREIIGRPSERRTG